MQRESVEVQESSYEILQKVRKVPEVGTIYRGRVVRNDDPSNTGRIKVRIFSLYSKQLKDEDLPWALPCFDFASNNCGSFIIPQVNDNVWVLFENNDIFKPVYIGSLYTTESTIASSIGSSTANPGINQTSSSGNLTPNNYVVMRTPEGAELVMNDNDKAVSLSSSSGGEVQLQEDNVRIRDSSGQMILEEEGRVCLENTSHARVDVTDVDGTPRIDIRRNSGNYMELLDGEGINISYSQGGVPNKISMNNKSISVLRNDDQEINMSDKGTHVTYKKANMWMTDLNVELSMGNNTSVSLFENKIQLVYNGIGIAVDGNGVTITAGDIYLNGNVKVNGHPLEYGNDDF